MFVDLVCIDVCGMLCCGCDVLIDVNCVFEGNVMFVDNVMIGVNCVICNVLVGVGMCIDVFMYIDGVVFGVNIVIGLYVWLCFGVQFVDEVYVGNFVEVKNVVIGYGLKVNYFMYIGDVDIGVCVNIGVGMIICNYDGVNKFCIVIEDDVFVGFDMQLVVFVWVGCGVMIVVGMMIWKDVVEGVFVLNEKMQIVKSGYVWLVKKKS